MDTPETIAATYWLSFWDWIGDKAFLIVVIALATEFLAARWAKPHREALDHARELQVAELNSKAESERLERLRLEAIVAPRSLTLEAQGRIIEAWRPFAGSTVGIVTYGMDGEAFALAQQIIACLRLAGINVENRTASVMPLGGFVLGINISGTAQQLTAALRDALANIGGLAVADGPTFFAGNMAIGPPPTPGAASRGPVVNAEAVILIGVKPVPTVR